ncbi:gluconokinase [Bacillus stercoris]|nr:gluconokinase [Bacillus stercoris]
MTSYMLGIDIGTTSTKAVLFSENGNVVQKESIGYPLYTPDISTAEQNPEEIFQAVIQTTARITKQHPEKQISFISFSSAMHSVIAIDENDKPLTPCITWADNRSESWAHKIKDELNGHEVYKRTGTPIHPMSPLSKIAWITNERKEIASKAKKYIGIKEYIFRQLFNEYVIDYSLASATGMMNLKSLDWDEEALRIAGITPDHLSKLVPTTEIFQHCSPEIAIQMGIDPETPFVIGASDGVLSNLGVNAIKKGEIAVTIEQAAPSGQLLTSRKPMKRENFLLRLDGQALGDRGPVNNGGIVLRWIRDEFASSEIETATRLGIDPYDVLTKIAQRVRPGSDGLLFHPYLAGERAPLWNPDVRGSFFGLTMSHKKEHMIRAALEGVIYNLYTVLLALTECMDGPVTRIKQQGDLQGRRFGAK